MEVEHEDKYDSKWAKIFPIYSFDTEIGSAILFNESVDSELEEMKAESQHLEN